MKSTTQEAAIDFGAGQSSLEELSGAAPIMLNFVVDQGSALRTRPGIATWTDFPAVAPHASPVIQMFAWRTYLIYVCEDRTIWAYYGPGDVRALSDATAATRLDGSLRPVFTYDYQRVVITGGGLPQKWEGLGLSARLGGSPPSATHIGYSATRFIVNVYDNTGIVQWTPSGVGNHETWNSGDSGDLEATAAPDPLVALYVQNNEVFVFGTQTVQVFIPDADTAYSVAASLSIGCHAPYSVIDIDDSFVWLDHLQRLVQGQGRSYQAISSPSMDRSIEELGETADCWGARISIQSFDFLVWTFPTEGRTLVYEQGTKKWSEWRSWDGTTWTGWVAQSHYYWAAQKLHLIGLADGSIGVLTFAAYKDMDLPIKAISRTGFRDNGTGRRKLINRVQLTLKRGQTLPGETAPNVELRYRDDLGAFRPAMNYSLGAADYMATIDKYALGMCRERQYELTYTGAPEFVLTGARETFEAAES